MVAIRIFIPSSRWLVISLFIIFNFAANIRIISEMAKKKKENHTIFSQIRVRGQVPDSFGLKDIHSFLLQYIQASCSICIFTPLNIT